ncbi:MAG: DUF4097 family beta strand repeat-containing protein [Actinomycetales bacterium]
MPTWTLDSPQTIDLSSPEVRLDVVKVRLVGGHIDLVSSDDGSATLEVLEITGPALQVSLDNGELVVRHEKVGWTSLFDKALSFGSQTRARLGLSVPATARVELASVSADALVAGIAAPVSVRSVSGDLVLDELSDGVSAQTVSGDLEARSVEGEISMETVSGDLTIADGSGRVRLVSVSGDLTADLVDTAQLAVRAQTVSGDVVVRLPHGASAHVDVKTTSGDITSELRSGHTEKSPGSRRYSASIGAGDGSGRVEVRTVSGDVTLLQRNGEPTTPAGTATGTAAGTATPAGTEATSW